MRRMLLYGLVLVALALFSVEGLSGQTVSSTDTTQSYTMRGTYYSDKFVGRKTSNGEIFVQERFTAAHKSFKFGTLLLVTNPKNGKQVIVRVNDRCPKSNILDLTKRAARQIGITSHPVKVEVLPPRCHSLWEKQEQLLEVLEKGQFRDYLALLDSDVEFDANKLYVLELFQCNSRDEAIRRVERLPIFYQDQVTYQHRGLRNRTVAVLDMPQTYIKAELVKKELLALFPDIKIVEAK